MKENGSELLGDYYSSGKIQSMLKEASWSHYFVLALERERFQTNFCSRGCDMLSVLYIELTCFSNEQTATFSVQGLPWPVGCGI